MTVRALERARHELKKGSGSRWIHAAGSPSLGETVKQEHVKEEVLFFWVHCYEYDTTVL